MPSPDPNDLIMIEPQIKSPLGRAKLEPKARVYYWLHKGEKIKINEIILKQRLEETKMVCTVDLLITRLYNAHSIVINTATGEVFDGSAAA